MQLPVLWSVSICKDTDKPKDIGFLETLHNPIYLEIILITPGIETQNNKKDDGIVELLIPTLNKIIRNKVFILQ